MDGSGRDSRPRGPYAKGVARRRQIVERAIAVFAERGADRTSLRAIAREVGVTHSALTHYFGSLEELLVAVYRETEQLGGGWPDDAEPVRVMIDSARANRAVPGLVELYSTLVADGLVDSHPVAREFASTRFAIVRERLADVVRAAQARGSVRADLDPVAVASLVVAASDGLQVQWLLDDTAPQEEALILLERLLRPQLEG